jgi:hypothetical protein
VYAAIVVLLCLLVPGACARLMRWLVPTFKPAPLSPEALGHLSSTATRPYHAPRPDLPESGPFVEAPSRSAGVPAPAPPPQPHPPAREPAEALPEPPPDAATDWPGRPRGPDLRRVEPLESENLRRPGRGKPPLVLPSYRWLSRLETPIFLVMIVAGTAAWAFAFHYLGEAHAASLPPAAFLFKPWPYGGFLAVPALFMGIYTAVLPVELFERLLLGRRYHEATRWALGYRGLADPEKLHRMTTGMWLLAWLVGPLSAVFAFFLLGCHVRFTDDAIVDRKLFSLTATSHPYSAVDRIVLSSHKVRHNRYNDEVVPEKALYVHFADRRSITFDELFRLPKSAVEQDRVVTFLAQKCPCPVTKVRLLEEAAP